MWLLDISWIHKNSTCAHEASCKEDMDAAEVFSGKEAISAALKDSLNVICNSWQSCVEAGFTVTFIDLEHGSCFDITTPAGFLCACLV